MRIGERDEGIASGREMCMHITTCMNDLLESESIESLSVKAICEAADISRTTFYNHFCDKYACYQWHLDHLYEDILSQAGRTCTFREANCRMLSEVKRLKHLYVAAAKLSSSQSLALFAQGRRERDLTETLVYHRGIAISDRMSFQIRALVAMEVTYVLRWFKEGMPLSVDEMADGLDEIVPPDLKAVLSSFPRS